MRPGVYASVARSRGKNHVQRLQLRNPVFATKRLMILLGVGGALFISGLVLTILGLQESNSTYTYSPAYEMLYTVIGPTACTIGAILLLTAILLYFCYGLNNRRNRHPSTASSGSCHHSAYSSVRSAHSHDSHDNDNKDGRHGHRPRCHSGSSNHHGAHHNHSSHHHHRQDDVEIGHTDLETRHSHRHRSHSGSSSQFRHAHHESAKETTELQDGHQGSPHVQISNDGKDTDTQEKF